MKRQQQQQQQEYDDGSTQHCMCKDGVVKELVVLELGSQVVHR
jgi:hypothetical protein